jgi:hypothetical protein
VNPRVGMIRPNFISIMPINAPNSVNVVGECPDYKWFGGTDRHLGTDSHINEGINQVQRDIIAVYPSKESAPEVVDGALPNDYESAMVESGKASHRLTFSQRVASGT